MKKRLILLLTLLCCSCIQLGGSPMEIDYYRLESRSEAPESTSTIRSDIAIKLIGFPKFIDRKKIVTHDHDNRVNIAKSDQWAEPLSDSFLSTLRRNLKLQLPQSRIALLPWENAAINTVTIELLVNDFSGQLGKSTWVDIDWAIRKEGKSIEQGRYIGNQEIGGSYSDLSAGLSRALVDLSRVLGEKLEAMK